VSLLGNKPRPLHISGPVATSEVGHSRADRADSRSGHFGFFPESESRGDLGLAASCPKCDISKHLDASVSGPLAEERKHHVSDEHQSAGCANIAADPRHQDPIAEQVSNVRELLQRTCYEEDLRWYEYDD